MKTTFIIISALFIFYITPLFGAVVVRHATPVYHHNTAVGTTAVVRPHTVVRTHPVARRSVVRAHVR